ncbi:hypothetical protein F5882DRAFT_395445 [Hyaloscypha sp. PMI_1271]|nr:hypothetical protein F5882DRAFT_395445 [Hyaloscypha sp. PMI_1271]
MYLLHIQRQMSPLPQPRHCKSLQTINLQRYPLLHPHNFLNLTQPTSRGTNTRRHLYLQLQVLFLPLPPPCNILQGILTQRPRTFHPHHLLGLTQLTFLSTNLRLLTPLLLPAVPSSNKSTQLLHYHLGLNNNHKSRDKIADTIRILLVGILQLSLQQQYRHAQAPSQCYRLNQLDLLCSIRKQRDIVSDIASRIARFPLWLLNRQRILRHHHHLMQLRSHCHK